MTILERSQGGLAAAHQASVARPSEGERPKGVNGFHMVGKDVPLVNGELERARCWGEALAPRTREASAE